MKIWMIAGGILVVGGPAVAAANNGHAARSAPVVNVPVDGGSSASAANRTAVRPYDRQRRGKPPGRDGGHRRHFSGVYPIGGYWGDGDGYVASEVTPDMFGYFATGGEVDLVDGEAVYDYDRGYPYDWYRDETGTGTAAASTPAPEYRCEVRWVPAAFGGQPAQVRICRR